MSALSHLPHTWRNIRMLLQQVYRRLTLFAPIIRRDSTQGTSQKICRAKTYPWEIFSINERLYFLARKFSRERRPKLVHGIRNVLRGGLQIGTNPAFESREKFRQGLPRILPSRKSRLLPICRYWIPKNCIKKIKLIRKWSSNYESSIFVRQK